MSGKKLWANCLVDHRQRLTPKKWPLSLAIVGALVSWAGVSPCPSGCRCADNSRWVECRDSDLTEIPRGIPSCAQELAITGNNISVLGQASFAGNGSGLARLATLSLQANRIQAIGSSAFQGLANLTTLNLSGNALASIAKDAFLGLARLQGLSMNYALGPSLGDQLWAALHSSDLPNLTELQLVGNYLTSLSESMSTSPKLEALDLRRNLLDRVERGTIVRWQSQRRLKVYLSSNPLVCDCNLQPVYWWLRNTSQIADGQRLTCFGPEILKGRILGQLSDSDLKCLEDTASYIFFAIVLALIGATFLMVLYLNREGIKGWIDNIQDACHDQMEGYHYRYEQESEPRLSSVTVAV
ncbi:trophoblast glycoprotein like [Heptranchias perlo]|uniref:trophoblast glycoprotein like n=1 Tax=Heptranchias perlo TaxID=212740 RepID=UPI00355A313E